MNHEEIARGMLARYSSPKVAAEMAHWHAMDHPEGSAKRLYWQRVRAEIIRLSPSRDQAGPAHQGPAGSGGRHVRKKHWATEAQALRAKRLKADHHQLARGPERLSFTIHAAKGYAVVTYPDRHRRTMTVPEARAIFRAHWRMGFRPLPQHETCECPAYRFPHRRGSGKCGDAMGGRRDLLRGGLYERKPPRHIDPMQLRMGIRVELSEHTNDPRIARQIALDHLSEDPRYYTKLARMEAGACGRDRTRASTSGFSRRQREKIHTVMHEYKHGRLRSGSKRGPRVRTREQAVAIAISEARREARKRGRHNR